MTLKRKIIYIDGLERTDEIKHISLYDDKYKIIFKKNPKAYNYSKNKIRIEQTAVSADNSYEIFKYLEEIASASKLRTEDDESLLSKIYQRITHISENSVLSIYLNGILPINNEKTNIDVFPFGFNLSQKAAVEKAFSNKLSLIEGPPGTGKTQTILNIVSNAIMQGKNVAVVSGNNPATKNVYEKLEKNGIEFIAAHIGNQ